MTQVDQFESVFQSASREVFDFQRFSPREILLVTDLPVDRIMEFQSGAQTCLSPLFQGENPRWNNLCSSDFSTTADLLEKVGEHSPDLIISYRNLNSEDWRHPHSLGSQLDVMIQKTKPPVLVLPHPRGLFAKAWQENPCKRVLALTDHLNSDFELVNMAASLVPPEGKLILVHVEDEGIFERYMNAVQCIPAIDTDQAREQIADQLLKQSRDYVQSVKKGLKQKEVKMGIEDSIGFGHRLDQVKDLIEKKDVDFIVLNTRDESQLALHGLSYPLIVEIQQLPVLML